MVGLPLVLAVGACGGQPTLVSVARGDVTSGVSATGTLQYVNTEKMGFPQGGKLVALMVKVGDHVTAGQPLAATDNTAQKVALRKAKDQVAREQAVLGRIEAGNQVTGADRELDRIKKQVDNAQDIADQIDQQDANAIKQLIKQLHFDQDEVDRQQAQLVIDQQKETAAGCGVLPTADTCNRVASRQDRIAGAKRQVVNDRSALDAARQKRDVDNASQEASINSAKLSATVADNKAGLAGSDRPFTIQEQSAILDQAQADVLVAQQAFDATIIHSSFNGIVGKINGSVGQILNASSVTEARALDTRSPDGVVHHTATAPDSGGGDSFIVLNGVDSYQVSAAFNEADAARMQEKQPAEVTYDGIPGLVSKGTISSITPADGDSGSSKGTNYIVKVALTTLDPRLKDGLTAEAHIVFDSVDNVLMVPKAAVSGNGKSGTVTMVKADGSKQEVPVETGKVGDTMTEIVSGVHQGDQVVLPNS